MSEETKKALEELRAIQLGLFRSAASLDDAIRTIEFRVGDPAGAEFVKSAIKVTAEYRRTLRERYEWSNLKDVEDEAWKKLIDSIKEEEKS